MAAITGPIRTLPGAQHAVPAGMMCDSHPDRPAVTRIQGETDSMGSEMIDCCAECRDAFSSESAACEGPCDWCHAHSPNLRDYRDFEEGSAGPVYQICGSCLQSETTRLNAELGDDDYDEGWGDLDYADDYDRLEEDFDGAYEDEAT